MTMAKSCLLENNILILTSLNKKPIFQYRTLTVKPLFDIECSQFVYF